MRWRYREVSTGMPAYNATKRNVDVYQASALTHVKGRECGVQIYSLAYISDQAADALA